MDPDIRKLLYYSTTFGSNTFTKSPRFMEDKKSLWRKILEFVIEVLKLILAIFLGLKASSML